MSKMSVNQILTQEDSKWNMCVPREFLICSQNNKWDFLFGWPRRTWRNFEIQITGIVKDWLLFMNRHKFKCKSEVRLKEGQKHKKVWQLKLIGKVQLVAFFNCRRMIYQHICPHQQKINNKYYTTSLKQLLVHVHRKCLKLVNSWILHRDNTPPHKAYCVKVRPHYAARQGCATKVAPCHKYMWTLRRHAVRCCAA